MSRLSAKVDIDREKGGVSMSVYGGYLKACGVLVVSLALGTSVFAQVRVGGGFPHQLTAKLIRVFLPATLSAQWGLFQKYKLP